MSCVVYPSSTEIKIVDDLFFKSMEIEKANTIVAQHSHKYQHISFVATGSVKVWKDNIEIGDYRAPVAITIEADTFHKFMSLEDNTVVWCIHNISRMNEVEVLEENKIEDSDYEYLSLIKESV